jgi:hypothetical protein
MDEWKIKALWRALGRKPQSGLWLRLRRRLGATAGAVAGKQAHLRAEQVILYTHLLRGDMRVR